MLADKKMCQQCIFPLAAEVIVRKDWSVIFCFIFYLHRLILLLTQARPILRDKDRLNELADPRLGGNYPKDDFLRVCTIAAACVALEANQRPTMGEVVQSLKMVQRTSAEYQDTVATPSSARPNNNNNNTNINSNNRTVNYESDCTSSMFSSGPFSGLSFCDNENVNRTAVFSEDLHEGR